MRSTSTGQVRTVLVGFLLAAAWLGHAPRAGSPQAGSPQAPADVGSSPAPAPEKPRPTSPTAPKPAANQVASPEAPSPKLAGAVVSAATGKPLPGARVEVLAYADPETLRARRAAREIRPKTIASAKADAEGRFEVAVPAATLLVVVAEAPGHARTRAGRPLSVRADRDLGSIELPAGRKITGRVADAAGSPIAGATVVAAVDPPSRRTGAAPSFVRGLAASAAPPFPAFATTAADGNFTLDGAPQRAVTIRAYAEGLAPAAREDVRASSGVTLKMEPGHAVAGKVLAPDGKTPVAGAWVMAGDEGLEGVTRSGKDGSFRLEHVPAGEVEVAARAAGDAAAASSTHAPSAPLALALPLAAKAAAPVLRLRPGGAVRARAIDAETREPVPGAILWLDAPGERAPRPATAGEKGDAAFTGVPVGNVALRAEADGYLEENLQAVPLAAGETRSMTAALRASSAVEGTVRDAAGRPVAGAVVSVSGPPPMPLPRIVPIYFPIGVDDVVSDRSGRFVLEALPARTDLKISVAAKAFAPWDESGIKLRPGERRRGMEVLLDAGASISGRVVDGEGKPVAAAAVTASRRRDEGSGQVVIRVGGAGGRGGGGRGARGMGAMGNEDALPAVVTGEDGVFRVGGVTPGVWSLEVKAPGSAPKEVAGLKVEEKTPLDAGDVVVEPGAFLRGIVTSASGEPVAYARCRATRQFDTLSEFLTMSDGSFVSDALAPGEPVTLVVDADGYAGVEKAGLAPPVEDLSVTLLPSSRISGRVVEKETGRPVQDFSVSVARSRSGGGGGFAMTMALRGSEVPFHSEDGTFVLEDVDPGKVAVEVRSPGYKEAVLRDLEVPEGKDLTDVVLTLDRAARVSGTVSDDRGRPLPGVTVQKKEPGPGFGVVIRSAAGVGSAVTDGDGNFYIEGLERGPMTLSFTHNDYEPADLDVDTSRDVEGIRVSLSRGATLSGIVLLEDDGSPIARANVTAAAVGSDAFTGVRSAVTGPDGAFTIEALSSGRYTLRAEAAGLRTATLDDVVVDAGAPPPPVELRMGGGVTLTGTLTGVKEQDLPKFSVSLLRGAFGRQAPVDAAGRFEMKGLSPGTVTLMAGSGLFGGRTITKTVEIPEGAATFETTIEFPSGSAVEGTVSRGGEPVAGASVIFMSQATRASATGTTDAAGHYLVEDLDSGEYDVSVVHLSSSTSHRTKVTVSSDRTFDVELPVARITGRVTDEATGQPLEGVEVDAKKEGAQSVGPRVILRPSRTDSTGFYQIEGLEEGNYTLTARREGYAFQTRPVVIVPNVEPGEISFSLARASGLAFRAVDGRTNLPIRSLSALVVAGGGDPLAPGGSGATLVSRGQIPSDASGLFELNTLQPGTYTLVLGGMGVATETIRDVHAPASGRTYTLVPAGEMEVRVGGLQSGQTARAVLVDAGGLPVFVDTFDPEPAFLLREGSPASIDDVKPGEYRLRVAMPDGSIRERPVSVSAGAVARVTIP